MGCEFFVIDNMLTGKLENIKHLVDNRLSHFVKGDVRDMDYPRQ
jgi:UDP-glucose 4-epimerase